MKIYCLLTISILLSCSKSYKSPQGYNDIKMYEYIGKPWDDDATDNLIYSSRYTESSLYTKIEKLNYKYKSNLTVNQRVDSALFRKNYNKYVLSPHCPIGYKNVLLLYHNNTLKYVVKFNEFCEEGFLINLSTKDVYYLDLGYNEFMKLIYK